MMTKGLLRKQVIIPMSNDNKAKFIEDFSAHITNINRVVMIDISCIQHGLGSRVMTTWSAALQLSQSAPHIVGVMSLLLPYVL